MEDTQDGGKVSHETSRTFETNFPKAGVQGAVASRRGLGFPQILLLHLLRAGESGPQKREGNWGTAPDPIQGTSPCNPASQAARSSLERIFEKFGMAHGTSAIALASPEEPQAEVVIVSERTTPERDIRVQAWIESGLIVLGLLLVAILLPSTIGGDGRTRYRDLVSLIEQHGLYQPGARYSLIGPLFSVPLYYIGKISGNSQQWIIAYNLILFSLCLFIVYVLLRKHLDRNLLRKFFLVLLYGSMFASHLTLYYGEVFTALFVGFGVLITFIASPFAWGWLAVALGVANTPVTLFALIIMILKRMIDSKRLRYILIIGGAGLLIGGEAWLRRGSPFSNGYGGNHGSKTIMPFSGLAGFSYPFFFGVLSILFSFGKGLIFFVPGLLLPVRASLLQWQPKQKINMYKVYTLWIWFVIGLIVVYAQWWAWYGGTFWGPRFFLFACIPASFALAVRLIRYKEASWRINLLTFIIFCLSAWVSVAGIAFTEGTGNPVCIQHNYMLEMLCWYTPEFSVLWLPFVSHPSINGSQLIVLVCSLLVAAYLVAPLFIYLLKQYANNVKEWSSNNLYWKLWRI